MEFQTYHLLAAVPSGAVLVPPGAAFPPGATIVPVYGPAPPPLEGPTYAGRRLSVLQDPPLSTGGAEEMHYKSQPRTRINILKLYLIISTLLGGRSPCRSCARPKTVGASLSLLSGWPSDGASEVVFATSDATRNPRDR